MSLFCSFSPFVMGKLFLRKVKFYMRNVTLAGCRAVELTEQRTRLDFPQVLRWLVNEVYPQARVIRLVMDNLNTHTAASLYEAFPPEEARRIWQRLEAHYTPRHGSWLNTNLPFKGTVL